MKLIMHKMFQNQNNNILENVNSSLQPISKQLLCATWLCGAKTCTVKSAYEH